MKDPKRLKKIRQLACALEGVGCYGPIEAHHRTGSGMALKAPDSEAFPLCSFHHKCRHDMNGYFQGWKKFQVKAWEAEMVAKYQVLYASEHGGDF